MKIICLLMLYAFCCTYHGHGVNTNQNDIRANSTIRCLQHLLWRCLHMCVCVWKVKNPHPKCNEILQAKEKGKRFTWNIPHTYACTLYTQRSTFFISLCVCARDLFHFKTHFRVFLLNTHRVCYILFFFLILICDRFLWNVHVSPSLCECMSKIHFFSVQKKQRRQIYIFSFESGLSFRKTIYFLCSFIFIIFLSVVLGFSYFLFPRFQVILFWRHN